jgi:hypothetical protein
VKCQQGMSGALVWRIGACKCDGHVWCRSGGSAQVAGAKRKECSGRWTNLLPRACPVLDGIAGLQLNLLGDIEGAFGVRVQDGPVGGRLERTTEAAPSPRAAEGFFVFAFGEGHVGAGRLVAQKRILVADSDAAGSSRAVAGNRDETGSFEAEELAADIPDQTEKPNAENVAVKMSPKSRVEDWREAPGGERQELSAGRGSAKAAIRWGTIGLWWKEGAANGKGKGSQD